VPTTPPTIFDVVGLIEPDPPGDGLLEDVPGPLLVLPPVFPESPKEPVVVDVDEEVCAECVSELETETDERTVLCAKGVLFVADAVAADPMSGVEMAGAELLVPVAGVGEFVGEMRDCDAFG
jgi:hypothetical protein